VSLRLPWRARAILAGVALNLCAGSLYSLSVLLKAFETSAGLETTLTAYGFSLAAGAFLGGVLTASLVGKATSIATQSLLVGALALISLIVAGLSIGRPAALAASALAYGWCCGQFYSIALSAVRRSGFAALGLPTGFVVASFAIGSAAWSYLIAAIVTRAGLSEACWTIGVAFALSGVAAAVALRKAPPLAVAGPSGSPCRSARLAHVSVLKLWVGFFAISAAGLAVISQAATLATSFSFVSAAGLTAAIGLANGVGRIAGGRLIDRFAAPVMLAGLAGFAAMTIGLVASGHGGFIATGAVLVALAYGAGSAAYPAVLMRQSSVASFPGRFARLFTAWGSAAILTPPLASYWLQATGGYGYALTAVAALNAAVVVFLLSRTGRSM
jgi:OFA family oxalate/formate antiporter-like MFS transporter